MKSLFQAVKIGLYALGLGACVAVQAVAPDITHITMVPQLTIQSEVGITNQIQYTNQLNGSDWTILTNLLVTQSPYTFIDTSAAGHPIRFYQVLALTNNTQPPLLTNSMGLIPAGAFTMGDANDGNRSGNGDTPTNTVYVSQFQIDKYEVTYQQWLSVAAWATLHGYSFDNVATGKATNHPVVRVSWYDAIKWCNARSEKEQSEGVFTTPCYYTNATRTAAAIYRSGHIDLLDAAVDWSANGYRLPTEAEWEKASRGGLSDTRFPWAAPATISHTEANFHGGNVDLRPAYDKGPPGYIPQFAIAPLPYSSPAGWFAAKANQYGLFDMAGNVREWCWDWYLSTYYSDPAASNDPHGPLTKPAIAYRVIRGGSYDKASSLARCADRDNLPPSTTGVNDIGFRCVRSSP